LNTPGVVAAGIARYITENDLDVCAPDPLARRRAGREAPARVRGVPEAPGGVGRVRPRDANGGTTVVRDGGDSICERFPNVSVIWVRERIAETIAPTEKPKGEHSIPCVNRRGLFNAHPKTESV